MQPTLIRIKKYFLGGSNFYYITKDKKYFIKINNIKVTKGKKDWIINEYNNLKKYWNKLGIDHFQLIEPVYYSNKNEFIVSKFVECKKLVDILNHKIYYEFGKKIKLFHEKGFSHSHLEVHDVLYKDGTYYLADVPFFNEGKSINDLVTFKLSLNLYKLKRPYYWYLYKLCFNEFMRGYKSLNLKELDKEYDNSIRKRIHLYMKLGIFYKIKAIILIFIYKISLL